MYTLSSGSTLIGVIEVECTRKMLSMWNVWFNKLLFIYFPFACEYLCATCHGYYQPEEFHACAVKKRNNKLSKFYSFEWWWLSLPLSLAWKMIFPACANISEPQANTLCLWKQFSMISQLALSLLLNEISLKRI